MKRIIIMLSLCLPFFGIAQTVDVVMVPEFVNRLLARGNNLYISGVELIDAIPNNPGDIYKINVTDPLPITSFETIPVNLPAGGMFFVGNELYIADFYLGKVVKMDITIGVASLTDVVTGLDRPSGLYLIGDEMFVTESAGQRLRKFNITLASPTLSFVADGFSYPFGMMYYNNELYIADIDRIFKIDPSLANPTKTTVFDWSAGLDGVIDMDIYNNKVYMCDQFNGRIVTFDPAAPIPNPPLTEVITGLARPINIEIINDELYIGIRDDKKVIKFDTLLSQPDVGELSSQIILYPNPTSGKIYIHGLNENKGYKIINMLGQVLAHDIYSHDIGIDISEYRSGSYFIQFEIGHVEQIIKE